MTRLTRRATIKLAAGGAALIALGTACQTDSTAPEVEEVSIAEGEIPEPGSAPFHSEDGKFFLVNLDEPVALYSRCTHRSCLVRWETADDEFHCPCHGSRFDRQGLVVNGPAERPLERMRVERQPDGGLVVHTDQRRAGG